ncbi:MAG: YHS domain-containing (seleno)protein [Crocosphaera sp.]|nr:YHS domain-containing (seleno)protein [Crocosphaera sp.]
MKSKKLAILTNAVFVNIVCLTLVITGCSAINRDTSRQTNSPLATQSQSENNTNTIFFEEKGVAIKGTDPVAYFLDKQAVQGNPQFSYQWAGTTWWFKSVENRDLFIEQPDNYAPQYGGFCAWAVSNNYTAPIDPSAWTIVEGKLYLNYDKNIQNKWTKNMTNNILKADSNWTNLSAELQTK